MNLVVQSSVVPAAIEEEAPSRGSPLFLTFEQDQELVRLVDKVRGYHQPENEVHELKCERLFQWMCKTARQKGNPELALEQFFGEHDLHPNMYCQRQAYLHMGLDHLSHETLLNFSIRRGLYRFSHFLMTAGADADGANLIYELREKDDTVEFTERRNTHPLHTLALYAPLRGDEDPTWRVLDEILARGGCANAVDQDGRTPLHILGYHRGDQPEGAKRFADALLAAGASLDVYDSNHIAMYGGNERTPEGAARFQGNNLALAEYLDSLAHQRAAANTLTRGAASSLLSGTLPHLPLPAR